MVVSEIIDIVHSAYKRSLDGAEKRSLREMINITQSTSTSNAMQGGAMMGNGMNSMTGMMTGRERGLLNPMRYINGKYV